jgi:hypothetical protein
LTELKDRKIKLPTLNNRGNKSGKKGEWDLTSRKKKSSRDERENNILSVEGKLREFVTSSPTLKKWQRNFSNRKE